MFRYVLPKYLEYILLGYSDSPAYFFVVYTIGMIMLHPGLCNYLGYIRYVT